jgi:uncharacterized membrane protein
MSSLLVTALLWTAALSSGLMAGVYFAFSVFIMKAFDNIDTAQSIAAMNAINEIILRSLFMPVFFGSSIISVLLIVVAVFFWGEAGSGLSLIAGMIYFFGMFVCTVVYNVPLNDTLSRLDATSENAQHGWSHYLDNWTKWNHLRTVSSLVTCALCIWLLTNS